MTEKKILYKSILFEFCAEFARNYKHIKDGWYSSNKGEYRLKKIRLPDNQNPVRVNQQSGVVEVNNNLDNYSEPILTFFLIWGFVRNKCIDEISADMKAMRLMLKHCPDFKNQVTELLGKYNTDSVEMVKRAEKLVNIL